MYLPTLGKQAETAAFALIYIKKHRVTEVDIVRVLSGRISSMTYAMKVEARALHSKFSGWQGSILTE